MRISRRLLMAGAGVSAFMPKAWAESSDALQDWLKANAVPVRSADDDDFSDLEPLIRHIGDARIVQLGEPSHGAGTAFAAKARLVRFLHQRLGFDVLVWESGFYDLTRTEAGLARGDDAVAAARRGVLQIWSSSQECRPLFEYAKNSHAGAGPLTMAGFDMQLTSDCFSDLSAELRAFVGGLKDHALRRQALTIANAALEEFHGLNGFIEARAARAADLSRSGTTGAAMGEALAQWDRNEGARLRPRLATLERLQHSVAMLSGLIDHHRAAFEAIDGKRRAGFMAHVVTNLASYGANIYEQFRADAPAGADAELKRENRRDARNAENLRWLIEEGYAGRKMIVWAHNVHVMDAYYGSDWKSVSLDPVPRSMKTMGVFLAERFGKDVYTIGLTAYGGEDGWVGSPPSPVPPASLGSIEERLHRLGTPFAFLDVRGARHTANPLRGPQTMRVPKYDEVVIADATRPYDAIFYIGDVKAATLIR